MSSTTFDLSGMDVMVALPIGSQVVPQTMMCLLDSTAALIERGIPQRVQAEVGCSLVQQARDLLVDAFLRSPCTHLFWIDADVTWKTADFLKLLALSTCYPIVLGSYPAKREPLTFFVRGPRVVEANEHGLLPIEGAGLGFCVMQRQVLEDLSQRAPRVKMMARPYPVPQLFRCEVHEGEFRGEDMSFLADCRQAGFSVLLDPALELGHVGPREYRGSLASLLVKRETHAA